MTSLAEAYEGHVGEVVGPRRLYLGVGLFLAGVLLTVGGMVVATTDVPSAFGLDQMAAWRRAGVLAGLGVPAVMGGVFTVLPSSRRIKAAATIGAGISMLGVALFWYAYPAHWAGFGRDLTLHVTAIYFFGATTSIWCLFVGIANFKRRNDPGGTVSLRVTKGDGETRVVEVDRSDLEEGDLGDVAGTGGVGLFGSQPDGDVETQTNDPASGSASRPSSSPAGSASSSASGSSTTPTGGGSTPGTAAGGPTAGEPSGTGANAGAGGGRATADPGATGATSDGGHEDSRIRSLDYDGEIETPRDSARQYADRYCGNCEHFRYVRTENGMTPYCGFHGEEMGDMEACEEWEPNH